MFLLDQSPKTYLKSIKKAGFHRLFSSLTRGQIT